MLPQGCSVFLPLGIFSGGMFGAGDFGDDVPSSQVGQPATKRQKFGPDGEPRAYLKVFETAPAQLLNAYGQGQFVVLPDDKVWHALCQPLATGAKYGTELASEEYLRSIIVIIIEDNQWLTSVRGVVVSRRFQDHHHE